MAFKGAVDLTPLRGKYRFSGILGQGGHATVYHAVEIATGQDVAIKVLTSFGDLDNLQRLVREAAVMVNLRHPHLVKVFACDSVSGAPYMVMEYLQGQPLISIMRSGFPCEEIELVVEVVTQIGLALEYVHSQHIVHRDVKPENVIIAYNKQGDIQAKLFDFTLLRYTDSRPAVKITRKYETVGSPKYMAPEQIAESEVDARADIYALGLILYMWLSGYSPFHATNPLEACENVLTAEVPPPSQFNPFLGKTQDAVCLQAVARDPNLRYQTIAQFLEAIKVIR